MTPATKDRLALIPLALALGVIVAFLLYEALQPPTSCGVRTYLVPTTNEIVTKEVPC